MPKLEDQISPQYLLAYIRSGTRKNEIVKEFRTNDRELAHVLLPLYRSGDMTKEEFNDFFKGLAVMSQTAEDAEPPLRLSATELQETRHASKEPAEGAQAKQQGTLAKLFSGLWQVGPPPAEPTGGPPDKAAESPEVSSEAEGIPLSPARQAKSSERTKPRDRNGQAPAHGPDVDQRATAPVPGPPTATGASVAPRTRETGLELVLKTILAQLDSIDARLSRIEKKLDFD